MNRSTTALPSTTRRLTLVAVAGLAAAATVVVSSDGASAHSPAPAAPGPTQSQVSSGTTDDRVFIKTHPREAAKFTTFRLDFVAGAATAWHRHTGPGLVTIIDGSFVLTWVGRDGCTQHRYSKGDAFVDPGDGTVHRLVATSPGALSATFVTPADQPATLPVTTPPSC